MKRKEQKFLLSASLILITVMLVALVIAILPDILIKPDLWLSRLDEIGGFINGVVGTAIILAGLYVAHCTLKETNSQTYQNTLALLLQSYHHTVEDYDYHKSPNEVRTGREAIKEILYEFKEVIKKQKEEIHLSEKEIKTFLTETFPTHIPAIVVSILYSVDKNCPQKKDRKTLFRQIEAMLSYEERILLLLFVAEQIANTDSDSRDDWELIKEHIFKERLKSKVFSAYPEYEKLFSTIDNR